MVRFVSWDCSGYGEWGGVAGQKQKGQGTANRSSPAGPRDTKSSYWHGGCGDGRKGLIREVKYFWNKSGAHKKLDWGWGERRLRMTLRFLSDPTGWMGKMTSSTFGTLSAMGFWKDQIGSWTWTCAQRGGLDADSWTHWWIGAEWSGGLGGIAVGGK